MPGPGPRGPRQTYRAPCSRFRDSRFLARDPQKTANSRAARGTRTRQPGTRSTTDGLLCGENRSAAGGTRARAARNAPAADRNPAHGPRSSSSSPSSSPTTGHQLDRGSDFFALFCGFCPKSPKNRRNRSRNLERIFSKKSRIGGNPPFLPKKNLDRVARSAPAAERNPPPDRAGAPAYRVRSAVLDHRIRDPRRSAPGAGHR